MLETEQVRELVTALAEPGAPVPVNLQDSVSRALEDIREQEERERDEQRQQRAAERLEERLVRLQEDLGLEGYQVDELRVIFDDESTRRDALMQEVRDSGDWGGMRDTMTALREETQEALGLVLSAEQLEQYNESNSRGFGRGGGFGGGGRGGRGGD